MSDITGLASLDPSVAAKAKQIQNMPPDKAIQFLLSSGVDSRVAGMVMKNMLLKKAAAAQGQPAPPPKTVSQELDDKVNNIAASHPRTQGIAGLSVPDQMFNSDQQPGMAAGGIVAFDDGGYISGPSQGTPGQGNPTDLAAIQQYNLYQQMQAQQAAQQAAQSQQMQQGMAGGGIVAFAQGGGPLDPDDPDYRPSTYQHVSNASKLFSGFNNMVDSAGGIEPSYEPSDRGVAPLAAQARYQGPNAPAVQGPNPGVGPMAQGAPGSLAERMMGGAPNQQQPGDQARALMQPPPAQAPPKPMPVPNLGGGNGGMGGGASGSGQMPGDFDRAEKLAKDNAAAQQKVVDENKPQDYNAMFQQREKEAATLGIGEAAKNHLAEIDQQKDNLKQLASQNKWLALSQAGFAMATAATNNPHGGFLGALAVGGQKGAQEFGKALADYHTGMMQLQDQGYKVQEAQEALKYDMSKDTHKDYDNQMARWERLQGTVFQANDRIVATVAGKEAANLTAKAGLKAAQIQADAQWKGPADDIYKKQWIESFKEQNHRMPTPQEYATMSGPIGEASVGNQVAQTRAGASMSNNAANNAEKLQALQVNVMKNDNYKRGQMMLSSQDPAMQARGRALMESAKQEEMQLLGVQSPGQQQSGGLKFNPATGKIE